MPALTRLLTSLSLVLGLMVCAFAAADDPGAADEQTLKEAGIPADASGLLEFFRKRTMTPEGQQKIEALVRQLGEPSFKVRSRASDDLVREGIVALPFLRRALKDRDLEVLHRAEECIRLIEEKEPRV